MEKEAAKTKSFKKVTIPVPFDIEIVSIGYKYTSLCSVAALNKSEYFLEIVDSDNKIKDFENQNISELFKTRQIGLFLRSVLDDIEVYIYPKTLKIYSDFLCFPGRMFSFIETIENPEEGFTEDYLKILYRINSFVKAFNSNSILMVGDTQSINWENIDEDLEEGWTSISEVLEKYKPRGIKIITEEMVLNKQLEPCDNEEEVYNHVYFFQFNKKNRETPITEITAPITPRNVMGW